MSTGAKIPLATAAPLAQQLVEQLRAVTARAEVAGSVRRQRPEIGDIEIVCEPLPSSDLFGGATVDRDAVWRTVAQWGVLRKAGDRFIQCEHRSGVTIDVFLVHEPAEWGPIFAIRTGPARLGQWAVSEMRRHGYRCRDGHIERLDTGERMPCPDEETFFRCAGLALLPPHERDHASAYRSVKR